MPFVTPPLWEMRRGRRRENDQVVALGDVPEFEQLSAELPDGQSDLSSSFFCKRFFLFQDKKFLWEWMNMFKKIGGKSEKFHKLKANDWEFNHTYLESEVCT